MGWFESGKTPGLILGDEPLDMTHEYLKQIAETYKEGCDRKPTLEELARLLELSLQSDTEAEASGDLEERAVVQVVIKTAKKPKNQKYKVGDVFAIPLGDGVFGFGRIMLLSRTKYMLIEVFRETSTNKTFKPSIVESGRLFRPIRMTGGGLSLAIWRWIVVASDDAYKLSEADAKMEFVAPDPTGEWCAVNLKDYTWRTITAEEAKGMESSGFKQEEDIEERIREELKKRT